MKVGVLAPQGWKGEYDGWHPAKAWRRTVDYAKAAEGLGFESGLDKRFEEAPAFYWLYTALIVFGAGVVLIPGFPLFRVMVLSQVANGVLLPFVLIFVVRLMNDRELMGEHANTRWYNIVSWFTVGVMILLTIAMVLAQLRGGG